MSAATDRLTRAELVSDIIGGNVFLGACAFAVYLFWLGLVPA